MQVKDYETILILTPTLSEEQTQSSIDRFRDFLQKQKAEIIHEDKIGIKKFAYPIQKKSMGIYHLFEFKAAPEAIMALETEYRRDEAVIRFLTVALDKHGIAYNEKKRNGVFKSLPRN